MSGAQAGKEGRVAKIGADPKSDKDDAEDYSRAQIQFDERANQVQAKEKDQSAGDRGEQRAVPEKERANSAGGRAERNENNRKAGNKGESRGE